MCVNPYIPAIMYSKTDFHSKTAEEPEKDSHGIVVSRQKNNQQKAIGNRSPL